LRRKAIWIYSQIDGKVYHDGTFLGTGYAGKGPGKNNPAMEDTRDVGPLPRGFYEIGDPVHDPVTGEYTLPLTPDPGNQMFGRSEFKWHGDNPAHIGQSSDGCIVSMLTLRITVHESADRRLQVISGT
jgi:hypothetical protein